MNSRRLRPDTSFPKGQPEGYSQTIPVFYLYCAPAITFGIVRGRLVILAQTLNVLDEKRPGSRFMRVHKSYIIPLNRIESVERNRIYISEAIIPLGDTYRDEFFRRIDG